MAWKPYQDQENRAYASILTSLFPEQTKTLPRILVWSIIFLADLILVVAGAFQMGLLHDGYGLLVIAAVIGLFWLQGFLWFRIQNLFRKKGA